MGRSTHYEWLRADKVYAERFAEAQEDAIEFLEQEARRRAIVGVEQPVVYQGRFCYETDPSTGQRRQLAIRKYSDALLIFLLKAARPERYRDRFEHTGPEGGSIPMKHSGKIVVIDGDTEAYIAGHRKAREAVAAGVSGDGHGDRSRDISGDGGRS